MVEWVFFFSIAISTIRRLELFEDKLIIKNITPYTGPLMYLSFTFPLFSQFSPRVLPTPTTTTRSPVTQMRSRPSSLSPERPLPPPLPATSSTPIPLAGIIVRCRDETISSSTIRSVPSDVILISTIPIFLPGDLGSNPIFWWSLFKIRADLRITRQIFYKIKITFTNTYISILDLDKFVVKRFCKLLYL